MSTTRELLEGFLGGKIPIKEVETGRMYYLNSQTKEKRYLDNQNSNSMDNPYIKYQNNDMQIPLLLDNTGNRMVRSDKNNFLANSCNNYLKFINYKNNPKLNSIEGSIGDGCANYIDMINTQVAKDSKPVMINGKQYDRSNDNYFHCKAHYQIANRGNIGYNYMSPFIGLSREAFDYAKGILKGKNLITLNQDWNNDMEVNNYGNNAAKRGIFNSPQEACALFRPKGLHPDF